MSVILECPVCEAKFRIEKIPPRINCPACKTNFKTPVATQPTDAVGTQEKPATLAQAPRRLQSAPTGTAPTIRSEASPPPAPEISLPGKSKRVGPPVDLPVQTGKSSVSGSSSDSSNSGNGIGIDSGNARLAAYPMRPKKNIWVTLTSVLLAVAAIGGLFAIVTILGQPAPVPEQTKSDDDKSKEAEPAEGALDKALANDKQRVPKKPELPPVDETPAFFKPRQCEIAWSKINGYVVKLDVRTPIRTTSMTGLIVDSRGWVVTSLSRLKDAGQVTVTLAGKNLSDDPPFRELVDLSRGIIATDPAHDLALISINRQQVINLADVKLKTNDSVVEATRYLIARTPPPRHRWWFAEARIAKRSKFNDLNEKTQRSIEKTLPDSDKQIRWVVYPPRLPTDLADELAGSPLIDESGTVVALNTGLTADKNALAVPAIYIQQLIDSVGSGSAETKPFARSADLITQITGGGGNSGIMAVGDSEVSPQMQMEQSFRTTLENLIKAADVCRKTDWSAELESEFSAMQDLSKYLDEAMEWQARYLSSVDNPEEFQKLWNEAIDEITESIEADLVSDEFVAGKGNEFFFKQANKENPWFMISAEVVSDQFNSPQVGQRETVVFEVLGTGKHVIAAAGRDARSFRRGRKFMLFGRLDSLGTINSKMFDGEPQIRLINVHTHFMLQNVDRQAAPRMPLDGLPDREKAMKKKGKRPFKR